MEAAPPRRTFQTLEGLRAVGAYVVATRHMPAFFGAIIPPESFLAVDLFYMVSGFVVAHAYERRLQAGGFVAGFMKTRLIRLYPLYALGMLAGALVAAISVLTNPHTWWTGEKIAEATLAGLFMAPLAPGLLANGATLNGPTWTLLPELIANLIYAAAIRFMNFTVLTIIVIGSGAALIYAELHYGTLDVGFHAADQWAAAARVGFSFFAGVLLYRLFGDKKHNSQWGAWACVGALAIALTFDPPHDWKTLFELALVFVGFPALVALAGHFEPGARTGRVFATLGLLSYAIYILHQPLARLLKEALIVFIDIPADFGAVMIGVAFLIALTGLAWWLDRAYDAPIRRVLRARFLPAPKPS